MPIIQFMIASQTTQNNILIPYHKAVNIIKSLQFIKYELDRVMYVYSYIHVQYMYGTFQFSHCVTTMSHYVAFFLNRFVGNRLIYYNQQIMRFNTTHALGCVTFFCHISLEWAQQATCIRYAYLNRKFRVRYHKKSFSCK